MLTIKDGFKGVIDEKTLNVANADFAAAIGQNKPNPFGKGHLQLYLCCLLVYLVSTMNGMPLLPVRSLC